MIKRKCDTPIVMGETCTYLRENNICGYQKGCSCQVPKMKYIKEIESIGQKELKKVL